MRSEAALQSAIVDGSGKRGRPTLSVRERSKPAAEQKKRRTKTLGSLQVIDLAHHARCSTVTVRRWSAGKSVQARIDEALTIAASKYGIAVGKEATT